MAAKQKSAGRGSRKSRFNWLAKLLMVLGLLLLVGLILLNFWVVAKFSGQKWQLPAQVYARPLELYPGARLKLSDLIAELQALGYRQRRSTSPGYWWREGRAIRINTRSFDFPSEGLQAGEQLSLLISHGELQWLRAQKQSLDLIRLEPLQIGGIYPANKEDRLLVQLTQVPKLMQQTLLAVEDQKFYQHFGISVRGIARAVLANVKAGRVSQGGSTLTQQLVKNYFLNAERSFSRKALEAVIAVLLELNFSKDDILEAYFNEVYLGQSGPRAIHGFGLAAGYYFNLPLAQLNVAQTALLVGLVKGPSYYDPWRHPQRAKKRRNLVLKLMLEQKIISQSQYQDAIARPLSVGVRKSKHRLSYPAYLDLVKRQLQREYDEQALSEQGLRIFTNFDPLEQWRAEAAVKRTLSRLERRYGEALKTIEAASIVTDVASGDVLAVVGGREPRFAGFNRALDARRQIGSLVKPAVYLAALMQTSEYQLSTLLDDHEVSVPLSANQVWQPQNFDQQSYGSVPLYQALAKSLNQATVLLGMNIGLERVIEVLHALGLEQEFARNPALLLGAVDLSPVEVALMYQTIANGGFQARLNTIRSVSNAEGQSLSSYPLDLKQAIKPEVAALIQYALMAVMREGTGRSAYQRIDRDIALAGKTGTSDEQRDSWFAGFSADKLFVVWLGRDDNSVTPLTGASGALGVWRDYMANSNISSFEPLRLPELNYIWVDQAGHWLEKNCKGARYMPFIAGSEPSIKGQCDKRGSFWNWFNW